MGEYHYNGPDEYDLWISKGGPEKHGKNIDIPIKDFINK